MPEQQPPEKVPFEERLQRFARHFVLSGGDKGRSAQAAGYKTGAAVRANELLHDKRLRPVLLDEWFHQLLELGVKARSVQANVLQGTSTRSAAKDNSRFRASEAILASLDRSAEKIVALYHVEQDADETLPKRTLNEAIMAILQPDDGYGHKRDSGIYFEIAPDGEIHAVITNPARLATQLTHWFARHGNSRAEVTVSTEKAHGG